MQLRWYFSWHGSAALRKALYENDPPAFSLSLSLPFSSSYCPTIRWPRFLGFVFFVTRPIIHQSHTGRKVCYSLKSVSFWHPGLAVNFCGELSFFQKKFPQKTEVIEDWLWICSSHHLIRHPSLKTLPPLPICSTHVGLCWSDLEMCVYTESGDVCVGANARQVPSSDSSRDICLCAPLSFYWLFMALCKNELIMIKWTEKKSTLKWLCGTERVTGGYPATLLHILVSGCRLHGSSADLASGHLAAKERYPSWSRSHWAATVGLATWKFSSPFISTQITSDMHCHTAGALNGCSMKLESH